MLRKFGAAKIVLAARTPEEILTRLPVFVTNRWRRRLAAFDPVRLNPDGYLYIRNRSISADETYGPNQNYDGWPSEELRLGHPTFVNAGIDIDHDPSLPIGTVLDSCMIPKGVLRAATGKLGSERSLEHFSGYQDLREGDQVVGDWIENVWAIEKMALESFYPNATEAILDGEITDTSMGCFVPGVHITMEDGTKCLIEDIQVGDRVLTHRGNIEPVTHTMRHRHTGLIYDIRVNGQRTSDSFMMTPEHPIWVRRLPPTASKARRKNLTRPTKCLCGVEFDTVMSLGAHLREAKKHGRLGHGKDESAYEGWVAAKDVKIGDWVLTPKLNVSFGVSDSKSSSLARLLGYYLAEGSLGFDKAGTWRRVLDVLVRQYDGDVYNFDVGGDDSYIADDIAVHNCEVSFSRCNICNHIAYEPMDYCQHIGAFGVNKGSLWDHPVTGYKVPSYERCFGITFFEDSLILPEKWNQWPDSQGADVSAKILQILASKHGAQDTNHVRHLAGQLRLMYHRLPEDKKQLFMDILQDVG